jgi:DNA-directed RNA polymerase subunit RPC12/RpoP
MKTSNKKEMEKKVYICAKCGKPIEPLRFSMEDYTYKRKDKGSRLIYYCSYSCMRAALREDEAKKQAKRALRRKTSAIV